MGFNDKCNNLLKIYNLGRNDSELPELLKPDFEEKHYENLFYENKNSPLVKY